jgi:hypothetical protein
MLTVFLTPFLIYSGIPLLSPVSLLTYLFLTVVGLLAGFFMIIGGTLVQVLLSSCVATLFAFYQMDNLPKLPFELRYLSLGLSLNTIVAITLYSLRKHLEQFLFIIFGVLWLGAFFQVTPPLSANLNQELEQQPNTSLPPYIHIILDEHIGIEGIPNYADPDQKYGIELKNKYVGQKFLVFGRAYSRYHMTKDSTASFLNFEPMDKPYKIRVNEFVRPNGLFEKLTEQGYIINIFQSGHHHYCDNEVGYRLGKCITYRVDVSHTANGPITILSGLLDKMRIFTRLNEIFHSLGFSGLIKPGSGPATTISEFNKHMNFLGEGKKGNAYFIHLMIPHHNWFYDENCSYKINKWAFMNKNDLLSYQTSPVWFGGKTFNQLAKDYSSDLQKKHYRSYLEQVKCSHKMVDQLLDKLNANPTTQDSTIVIQGDHGSRITSYMPIVEFADQITKEDYIQFFSTFFAVRGPNHTPGYDRRPMALDELTRLAISTKNSQFENGKSKFVYLPPDQSQQLYKKYSLPPFANGQPAEEW